MDASGYNGGAQALTRKNANKPRRLQISNYAKPGHESCHNRVYWRCQPYYAFGLGAASYTRGRRFSRPRDMAAYERWVRQYVVDGGGCPGAQLPEESQVRRRWLSYALRLLARVHVTRACMRAVSLTRLSRHARRRSGCWTC